MAKNNSTKEKSIFENKKLFYAIVIASVIILFSVAAVRFGGDSFSIPADVGKIGQDHAHAIILVSLNGKYLDLDASLHPEYVSLNEYILLDGRNFVHRTTTGATLGMYFESLGMKIIDDCFSIYGDFTYLGNEPLEQTEFCNDGDNKLKVYVGGNLIEETFDYVFKNKEIILLAYDDDNSPTRAYPSKLSGGSVSDLPFEEPDHEEIIHNP